MYKSNKFNLSKRDNNKNLNIVVHHNKKKSANLTDMIPVIEEQPNKKKYTHKPRIYEKEEIKIMLQDYILLPKNIWSSLKKGDHIRYQNKDGKFRSGGYVLSTFTNNKTKNVNIKLIVKINSTANPIMNPSWIIDLNNIENIWKKKIQYNEDKLDKLIKIVHQNSLRISKLEKILLKYIKKN